MVAAAIAFAVWCGTGVPTRATEILSQISTGYLQNGPGAVSEAGEQSVLMFGGALTTDNMSDSLNSFGSNYDGGIAGIAYDRDFWKPGAGLALSGEIGLAGRLVDGGSAEFWGGARIRRPFVFGGLCVTPALTVGLSAVTRSIPI